MAKKMIDFALGATDEDLVIDDSVGGTGDFVLEESTSQHQRQLLLNAKGDFKENPTICVNAFNYLDGEDFAGLMRAIAVEFSKDGMDVDNVGVDANGEVKVSGKYT
jgi:hypothetical protein